MDMDNWQVAQNYIVAAAIAGTIGGYYYYTSKQKKPNRTGSSAGLTTKRGETELRQRSTRGTTKPVGSASGPRQENGNSAVKKRKVEQEEPQLENTTTQDVKAAKESDMSTAQFAQQMVKARQGAKLNTSKGNETRVKTVKPRLLSASSESTSIAGADTPVELNEEAIAAPDAGDISDMLEAKAPTPTTLRITASEKPQTARAPRQAKQEVVENKKQRQHRRKAEERKQQLEEDERERKVLEEKQRRTAREARGEPAKNGLNTAKAPTSNAWESKSTKTTGAPLLDTFDAESTSSSNGGLEASTAATSTTEGDQAHHDGLSEEDQMAAAIKQSGDESGWTTISAPKKPRKQPGNGDNAASSKVMATGAFSALEESSNDSTDWQA